MASPHLRPGRAGQCEGTTPNQVRKHGVRRTGRTPARPVKARGSLAGIFRTVFWKRKKIPEGRSREPWGAVTAPILVQDGCAAQTAELGWPAGGGLCRLAARPARLSPVPPLWPAPPAASAHRRCLRVEGDSAGTWQTRAACASGHTPVTPPRPPRPMHPGLPCPRWSSNSCLGAPAPLGAVSKAAPSPDA